MPRRDLKAGVDETVAAAASVPRWPSGMFSGAADSGIWPGMTRGMQGATAFITPSTYGFIFIWYLTGALTNTYSRQTMLAFKSPPYLSLTLMQHVMAMLCGTFGIRVLQLRPYKPLPPQAHTFAFYRLLFVYSAGFCLTNGSFGKVNASFVDTIKAGEPIATVVLTLVSRTALPFFVLLRAVGSEGGEGGGACRARAHASHLAANSLSPFCARRPSRSSSCPERR